ncbi:uncharacterized protein LOC125235573 [Leguminivora glycinivorella]|uniref:uncharacterized protein LOC125235573 n=1 Tax=Leguminivora glycinivorella TaxID=1035111 RepID=UPI00200F90D3|nr:uncharacterized protein LOC125235573 [Leguminivora glycinivorella]
MNFRPTAYGIFRTSEFRTPTNLDVHRSGVEWNDHIRPEEHARWVRWLDELKLLASLRILDTTRPRGHGRRATMIRRMGKSRVTQLRPVSIPRLELQGCLLSARLAATIQSEHKDIKPNKRYFWMDSNTALQWIRSDPRDFKPYVAHRLGEIDELTSASEWRYVPTSLNVADVATREDAPPLQYDDVWFQGPNFLREREGEWPKDLKSSKQLEEAICEQIACLRNNKPLSKDSRLLQLTPYLDDAGLLRVEGRIDKTVGVNESTKRPVILDGKHRITRLLVEHYHRRALHRAQELVVNELRQRYWILQLRPTVRAVAAHCLLCRYRRATPQPQRMGDLPAARLQHNRRPFSFTGVDFFGPMEVTVGRGRQKRYGMLFTCLTIRAVHVEITENLTTDSTIMGLRRMIARRGTPTMIYCDNGTNLRGAHMELKRSIAELDSDALRNDGLVRGIEWKFIPPGAPEMAGAWERMVRTFKSSLRAVLKERAPRPETLSTLMAEVEALVNSRPITYVSVDPNYPEALTPNHFLIGTSSNGPAFD